MVICSFQKPMDWLQSQEMAPMLENVDLAVYAKGNKTFDDVSALSKNLRFFKRVPNFGLSGGSREPYALATVLRQLDVPPRVPWAPALRRLHLHVRRSRPRRLRAPPPNSLPPLHSLQGRYHRLLTVLRHPRRLRR